MGAGGLSGSEKEYKYWFVLLLIPCQGRICREETYSSPAEVVVGGRATSKKNFTRALA